MKELVKKLNELHKTISTMESCSGGGLANAITNVEHASGIIKFSAVTYSNEFKIKMGVNKDIIDKYTVYSMETAMEMSKVIAIFANSNYGVGITGKLNYPDVENNYNKDNIVYISIYDADNNKYYKKEIFVYESERSKNKETVINTVLDMFKDILKLNL